MKWEAADARLARQPLVNQFRGPTASYTVGQEHRLPIEATEDPTELCLNTVSLVGQSFAASPPWGAALWRLHAARWLVDRDAQPKAIPASQECVSHGQVQVVRSG